MTQPKYKIGDVIIVKTAEENGVTRFRQGVIEEAFTVPQENKTWIYFVGTSVKTDKTLVMSEEEIVTKFV